LNSVFPASVPSATFRYISVAYSESFVGGFGTEWQYSFNMDRPSSANRSRTTPLTSRPKTTQISSIKPAKEKRNTSPARSIRFDERPSTSSSAQPSPRNLQRANTTFVTSNLPTLTGDSGKNADPSVPQTENKSALLLRGLVSAETGFNKKSTLEVLISAFLRIKSDVKVLRDFSKYCLTRPQDVDSNVTKISAQDLFAPNVNDSMRIVQILKLNELRDKLIFDICSGLITEKNVGMKEGLEPLPNNCSEKLSSLLTFYGTFMEIAKEVESRRLGLDQAEERTIAAMQEKYKTLEQSYVTLRSDAKVLKAKYDSIMTDGGKHQGMARHQHTIDELELKVKNISKHIEDADNAKKTAMKSELKMKDDVLRLEAQLEALRATYEGELGTLKPMVYEQVSYTSESRKEIRDLQTNVLLGKERHSVLNNLYEESQYENQTLKLSVSELARQLGQMTDKADGMQSENSRLERVLKVTAAAKLSSDAIKHELESKISNLVTEVQTAQRKIDETAIMNERLTSNLHKSENTVIELQDQNKLLTLQYDSKCCEVVSIEGALQEQADQIEKLMKRIPTGATAGAAPISFDVKKDRNLVERRKSNISGIPDITIGGDMEEGGGGPSPRNRQSELLSQWSNNVDEEHMLEIKKKDHKIKKLEDKLRKSQINLKDALDKVYQLEKVRIDEAAGAIPQRRV